MLLKPSLALSCMLLGVISTAVHAQTCQSDIFQATPDSQLIDHNNGTVTDTATGLMWKQCSEGQTGTSCTEGTATKHNWKAALEQAANADFAGHSDWRLPNIKELRSIVEESCHDPSINLTRFPNTPFTARAADSYYWSSTTYAQLSSRGWYVNFSAGNSSVLFHSLTYNVRLVRAGQ